MQGRLGLATCVAGFGLRDGLAAAVSGAGADRDREDRCPQACRPQQSEVKKGRPGRQSRAAAPSRAATGWSAEVSDRAVAATAAEIGGDEARTRFSLHAVRPACPTSYFTLADPYRLIIDMPDVSFRLPKGAGQQGRGLIQAYRYGLFAPGKSRIVIDTKGPVRVERAAMASRPGSRRRASTSTCRRPTGRAS